MMKRESVGKSKRGRPSPDPEVVWLSEPPDERIVRAQLRLLGHSTAEMERAMREQPMMERQEEGGGDRATD